MTSRIYVFDPTVKDPLSQVRGIGRYLQILKENFTPEFTFTSNLQNITPDSVLINPFFNFLAPPLLMRKVAKKQVAIIHDLIPLKYPDHFPLGIKGKFNLFLNRLALKNYDLIVTDSEASKKDITRMLKVESDKIKVIYPTLPKIFQTRLDIDNCKFIENWNLKIDNYCLYVGDATWNKNLINLAKAIKIINVTCMFVGKVFAGKREYPFFATWDARRGDPPETKNAVSSFPTHPWQKELLGFLKEIEGDKRFILKGFVSDQELISLYQQARLNILVSRDEGFGFSYLEAASQSCPSVLSAIPVLQEIAGETASFARPQDSHDIANQISEIYFNSDLRESLGLQAKKRAGSFSREKFKEDWQQALTFK